MTGAGYGLLFITGLLMAAANLLMKRGIAQARHFVLSASGLLQLAAQPAFLAGIFLSGVAAVLWFRVLSTQKLSTCYPIFVSVTYALVTVGAFYFFQERISVQKMAGLGAIVLGIVVVARG